MRHPAGFRDIPSRDRVGEVDIREEKMNAVCLPHHLQRAGSDGGLKHAPSLPAKKSGDILPHQPIVLNHQGRQAIEGICHTLLPRGLSGERPWKPMVLLWTEVFDAQGERHPRAAAAAHGRTKARLSGFLVDGRLREAAQQSVGLFFFLQCFIEQADRVFQPELASQVLSVP